MLRKCSLLFFIAALAPTLLLAQQTGKISGLITDAASGDPLPGANILLVGSTLGTISDVEGNFFILGVPGGKYDVQASFIGYQSEIRQDVQVSVGYTQELIFSLSPGVELDEIIVLYERPLIQKDAIGVPKIITAEEIVNLPVRGTTELASIQAGVVSKEGSGLLNVRGGRTGEVAYYIDGVKVFGTTNLPQSAVQEQEMLIGGISARYGDAMSGIINITTKSGASDFFGSVEAITSESLDDYGYNLISASIGGPVLRDKLSFFLSGELITEADRNPRSVGELYLPNHVLDDLNAAPIAFKATDVDGSDAYLPIPASLADGASMIVDDNGVPVTTDGFVNFDDGTSVAIAEGLTIANLRPVTRAELINDEYELRKKKRKRAAHRLYLAGNLTYNILDNARIRVGGRLSPRTFDQTPSNRRVIFAPEMAREQTFDDYQLFGTWTHYLSNNTFYQLQVDWSDRRSETYDPRFGKGLDDLLSYGDLEHEAFQTLRGYKNLVLVADPVRVDSNGDPTMIPIYVNTYDDGAGPASSDEVVATMLAVPGGRYNFFYIKDHDTQFRFSANATTQVGLHQIEFGAEYETRTFRYWDIRADLISRYVADEDGPEQIEDDDPDLPSTGFSSYDEIPSWLLNNWVVNYGYDIRGENEIDSEDFDCFLDREDDKSKPLECFNVAPFEPIYYGGYIQDKIEFRDIILNLGLRVDVYDNNTRVLVDKYALRPIQRAGSIADRPSNIGTDFAVYFSGADIVGYRDLLGGFFDADGAPANPGDIILNGKPNQTGDEITEDMFSDYDPKPTFMPRIGVSFPVSDNALFFASYGIVSQRPTRNFLTLRTMSGTGRRNNTALNPEKTVNYEIGFRQRVAARAAFTLTGFVRQTRNLTQRTSLDTAFPGGYATSSNNGFATTKGVEFGFDLRRTSGFSANVNYTLAYADGTGSDANAWGASAWINEALPQTMIPLNYDQRHKLNASLDYRLGQNEGPTILGTKLFQSTGLNVLVTAGSGYPFTGVLEPRNLAGAARAEEPRGGINDDNMPSSSRVDVRLDRRFKVSSGASLSAFIWVQNLFDSINTLNVWRFTGLPLNDGFLESKEGARFLADKPAGSETIYRHRTRNLNSVGIPRLIRVGARIDF